MTARSKSNSNGTFAHRLKNRAAPLLLENKKIIAQFIFTFFFIAIGIWFIKHESTEIVAVKHSLTSARWQWVMAGLSLTILYILLQGQMYVYAFASVQHKVSLADATLLFIKRNFISVFLPAGGVSSLAFFTGPIEAKGIKDSQIHFASSIYGFVGILSILIVALPAFIYAVIEGTVGSGEWLALASVVLLIGGLLLLYRSVMSKGRVYKLLVRYIPVTEVFMNDLQSSKINRKKFLLTLAVSVLIEFTGIAHLYVAMIALNVPPSLFAAVMGYIVSVVFLVVSPFLRGLGAIEVSMSFILVRFGFSNVDAIAITFLYRFFEFWTPLLAGILAFLSRWNKLLMRILPAIFLMTLGVVNIVSVMTPAISGRLKLLHDFLPMEIIYTSNFLVMMAGLFLLVTAAFMLKGLRTAWWFALFLSLLSFIGNITKAIDFEEASFALLVIIILLLTHKEYYIRTNPRLRNTGVQTALLSVAGTLVYGIIGFFFLDKKYFNIDFSLLQSIKYTLQNYFLIGSSDLVSSRAFANNFLYSINISGFLSMAFLVYTLVRTYVPRKNLEEEELALAHQLVSNYGKSALDHFKTYSDKMIFFSSDKKAMIAYRISGNYAVALENPVAENQEELKKCIIEFDRFCYESGLKSIHYRVPEEALEIYKNLRKKELFLGQEGVVDLSTFTTEGGSNKSLRNAINKTTGMGFSMKVHEPPVKDGVLQKIKLVSDEWLKTTEREEIIFSQGMFQWEELKQQTILTVENDEGKIVAFLNVIPDYAKGEATYDLVRKTNDAPPGVIEFLLIEFFNYLKSLGYKYVNLGFAPMSGMNDPQNFSERSMKFAYEKIRSFSHYKGLREYKEKFGPVWFNKYLIYEHDYDLLQVPSVLAKVIKP